jgi:hypothetical protein
MAFHPAIPLENIKVPVKDDDTDIYGIKDLV